MELIELDLALGQSRDCADVVWVELEHALAILGALGEPALNEQGDRPLVVGFRVLRSPGDQPGGRVDGCVHAVMADEQPNLVQILIIFRRVGTEPDGPQSTFRHGSHERVIVA